MATLKTNTLTGTSTAGSIAVTGEGNSTTTNLQQGLCKGWCNLNGAGTIAVRDIFNNGSVTDVGTGNFTFNHTNNLNNANYSGNVDVADTASNVTVPWFQASDAITTSTYKILGGIVSDTSGGLTGTDCDKVDINFFGDLA